VFSQPGVAVAVISGHDDSFTADGTSLKRRERQTQAVERQTVKTREPLGKMTVISFPLSLVRAEIGITIGLFSFTLGAIMQVPSTLTTG
jgi:hypothetical protein